MNYRQRRNHANLSIYTVAKELGISYEKYMEVDRGERNLEGNMVNKFIDIIKRAKEIKFSRAIKMQEVDEYIASEQAKTDLKKMGYSQISLADELGLTQGAVCNAMKNRKTSDDTKERIYDFLHEPLNKKIVKVVKEQELQEEVEEKQLVEEVQQEEVKEAENIVPAMSDNESEMERLKEENSRLKRQIYLYEKMIERL